MNGADLAPEQVALIGAGRLGMALAQALSTAGLPVRAVIDPDPARAEICGRICGSMSPALSLAAWPESISMVFLAVPDDAIAHVAADLAKRIRLSSHTIVAHCSGALPSSELVPLAVHTTLLASFHPLQTFSGRLQEGTRLQGIYVALEGHADALPRLQKLAELMGSRTWTLTPESKPSYHLACVLAANYFVGLEQMAAELLQKIGIPPGQAFQMLAPLLSTTLDNLTRKGAVESLTGPVARGDVNTIEKHLRELKRSVPEFIPVYVSLGQVLIRLAREQGGTTKARLNRIMEKLQNFTLNSEEES